MIKNIDLFHDIYIFCDVPVFMFRNPVTQLGGQLIATKSLQICLFSFFFCGYLQSLIKKKLTAVVTIFRPLIHNDYDLYELTTQA